tara:strand:+ start:66530 stop:66745 length:216 start_codon:yes stop_codon:yes gene_type:complete
MIVWKNVFILYGTMFLFGALAINLYEGYCILFSSLLSVISLALITLFGYLWHLVLRFSAFVLDWIFKEKNN